MPLGIIKRALARAEEDLGREGDGPAQKGKYTPCQFSISYRCCSEFPLNNLGAIR